jgi:hypothetical protein
MQLEFSEVSSKSQDTSTLPTGEPSCQHGLHQLPSGPAHEMLQRKSSMSPQPRSIAYASVDGVDAQQLEQRLRGLNGGSRRDSGLSLTPGQRISEYEKALTPSVPREAFGFKVIRRADGRTDGVQLEDLPNGSCSPSRPADPSPVLLIASQKS